MVINLMMAIYKGGRATVVKLTKLSIVAVSVMYAVIFIPEQYNFSLAFGSGASRALTGLPTLKHPKRKCNSKPGICTWMTLNRDNIQFHI